MAMSDGVKSQLIGLETTKRSGTVPGYVACGRQSFVQNRYRTPFRLPSLNASPTCSVDDLSLGEEAMIGKNSTVLVHQVLPDSLSNGNSNGSGWRQQKKCDSPGSYRKTLEELAALRKQRPTLGSTSDYFSLTGSMCSDDGDNFTFDVGAWRLDTDDCDSDYGWPLSPTDVGELSSIAQHAKGGDHIRIRADLLDNICQQTRELERRNEELRQELEQLHFDTKKFVEKNAHGTESQKWAAQDFQLILDDNETII